METADRTVLVHFLRGKIDFYAGQARIMAQRAGKTRAEGRVADAESWHVREKDEAEKAKDALDRLCELALETGVSA